MKQRRKTIGAEEAEKATGYSANGESEHTRRSARPTAKMPSYIPRQFGKRALPMLVAEQKSLLAKLRGDILLETNSARRAKLQRNAGIKTKFIERLEREIKAASVSQ